MNIPENNQYIINTGIGITGGVASYAWLPRVVVGTYSKSYLYKGKAISKQEQEQYWKTAEIVLQESGLKSKNVRLININDSNAKTIADEIIYARNKKGFFRKTRRNKNRDQVLRDKIEMMYAKGRNACYVGLTSQILVNKEKMAFTAFHEMGHAYNAKFKGIQNGLSRTRGKFARLIPFIFGAGLMIPKDNQNKPTENPLYKILLEFRKSAGLLVSLCLLPTVAEEGLASINGAKLAKKYLSTELYKKMNSLNTKAFISYVLAMFMAGLGTNLAIYIKDKVTGELPKSNN